MEQVQEPWVHTGQKNTKNWRKKNRSGILHIPGSNIRRPNMVAHKKGKEDAPDLSTESAADNTASCIKRQSDECRRKAEYQHEGHRGSGSKSQVEMGKPCGKNGPVQMGKRHKMLDVRLAKERGDQRFDRQTRSREWKDDNDHEQPKTGANVEHSRNTRKGDISRDILPSD